MATAKPTFTFELEKFLTADKMVNAHGYTPTYAAERCGISTEKLNGWLLARNNWRTAQTHEELEAVESAREEVKKLEQQCTRLLRTKQFLCQTPVPNELTKKPRSKSAPKSFRRGHGLSRVVAESAPSFG